MPNQSSAVADLVREQYALALSMVEQGHGEAAILALQSVISLSPDCADAWGDLGAVRYQAGDLKSSIECLRTASRLDRSNTTIKRNLAEVLIAREEYPEAKQLFTELVPAFPGDMDLRAKLEILHELTAAQPARRAPKDFRSVPVNLDKIRRWESQIVEVTQNIARQALQFLPPGGVLVDIGANVGLLSAQVLAERPCQAYLFEPVPEYWAYCCGRFQGRSDVAVENVALSDAPGTLSLWLGQDNLGWNTMVREKTDTTMHEVVVDAVVFDDWAEAHGIDRIDVIKLDVEGGEYKVLGGMHRTLSRLKKKPYILCEIGWGPKSHPNWAEEVRQFEWLFANGYRRLDYNVPGTADVIFQPCA